MFTAIRELGVPGVVEHAVRARFLRPGEDQLVVCRRKVLDVFQVDAIQGCLKAEASFKLFGIVESMNVVESYDKEKRDLILLSFGRGRASLVCYDDSLGPNVLRNVALYNFEPEALGSNLRAEATGRMLLKGYGSRAWCIVDPKCAAVMLSGNQIGVVPLAQYTQVPDEDIEEAEVVDAEEMKIRLAKAVKRVAVPTPDVWEMHPGCYLVDLSKLGIPQGSVIHSAFLKHQRGLPVLVLLHHGLVRASTGRIVVSRWTCQLTAITLSKHDVTVVWKVKKLPHDSIAVVPTDMGDALVISQNTVHLVVGGSIKRTLEVNGFARATANVNHVTDNKSNIEMSLDNVRWVWLDSYRLLLSLRYGQMALLDVGPHEFRITLHGLSNQASCLCTVGSNYIFLGSRLADSLLVHFKLICDAWEDADRPFVDDDDEEERVLYSTMFGRQGELQRNPSFQQFSSLDGAKIPPWSRCRSLVLRTTDALPCTGPIAGMTIARHRVDVLELNRAKEAAKALQSQGMHSAAAKILKTARDREKGKRQPREVLVSAGRGRDGGIRITCPALRLDTDKLLLADVEMPSRSQSLWTIRVDEESFQTVTAQWDDPSSFAVHKFVRAPDPGTSKPQYRVSKHELSRFSHPRSLAFSAVPGGWIVQVCFDKVLVFSQDEAKLDCTHSIEGGFRSAYIFESYVFLVLRSREPCLYRVDEETGNLELQEGLDFRKSSAAPASAGCVCRMADATGEKRLVCAIVRAGLGEHGSGALEVYDIVSAKLVFRSDQVLALGHRVVVNRHPDLPLEAYQEGILAKVKVVSVCIGPVGRLDPDRHCSAHLVPPEQCICVAFRTGDLLVYKIQGWWERLHRVESDVITRIDRTASSHLNVVQREHREHDAEAGQPPEEAQEMKSRGQASPEEEGGIDGFEPRKRRRSATYEGYEEDRYGTHETQDQTGATELWMNRQVFRNKPRLFAFEYLNGFCGMMLVSGQGICTCITGSRGQVSVVRLDLEAHQVWDMAVVNGTLLILATSRSEGGLPRIVAYRGLKYMQHLRFDYGGSIPFVHLPLKASVIRMLYDNVSRCCVLLCAEDEGKEEMDLAVRANCSIRVLSCDTWDVHHQYSLMRHEKPVCVKRVTIEVSPQNITPKKIEDYIAVGTGFLAPQGEDAGCKGRILVFAIEEKEGRHQLVVKHKVESKHIRGPITSISSVDGLLFATFGSTPSSLRCFYFDTTQQALVDRSILDTPFCGVELHSIKNYLLVGDLYRSVRLLHWHGLKKEFRVLSRDKHPLNVYSCNFLQSEKHLGIVVTDGDSNLHIMHFDAQKDYLSQRGEIALSDCATQLIPLYTGQDRQVMVFGCLDGTTGVLVPMSEQVFRRLFALQAAMSSSPVVPRNAGLNPRAFRMTEFQTTLQRQRNRTVADGALLWSFLLLDYISQRHLARLIGTTPETIYQDLLEIDSAIFWKAL